MSSHTTFVFNVFIQFLGVISDRKTESMRDFYLCYPAILTNRLVPQPGLSSILQNQLGVALDALTEAHLSRFWIEPGLKGQGIGTNPLVPIQEPGQKVLTNRDNRPFFYQCMLTVPKEIYMFVCLVIAAKSYRLWNWKPCH